MKKIIILFLVFFVDPAYCVQVMNGVSFREFFGFEKKWSLITVRYRTDTGEQRFTYANELARKNLIEKNIDYPNGAVFGKIGIGTMDDPHFTSSKVPSGARRIQLMVRDKKKYQKTGGWGYALFDARGNKLSPESDHSQAMACFACHEMVKDQGYVFSNVMNLSGKDSYDVEHEKIVSQVKFSSKKVIDLEKWITKHFNKTVKDVQFLEGKLREFSFQGTFNEIIPSLIKETKRSGKPSILLTSDGNFTVFVTEEKDGLNKEQYPVVCPQGERKFLVFQNESGVAYKNASLVNRVCE